MILQSGHVPPHARTQARALRRSVPWTAIAASLFAHAVLLAVALRVPLPGTSPTPGAPVITMRLAAPTPEPAPAPEARPEPPADPPPTAPARPLPEPVAGTSARREAGPDSEPEETGPGSPASGAALRAAVLEQAGTMSERTGEDADDALPWTVRGERIPGLPGVRGWLSGHVGRVTPSTQTWTDNDGSRGGRHVLADGTVVCTRRRAPTIDELMNPWTSMIVTMGSICGRERPPPPDFSDPRVPPPPPRARRSSSPADPSDPAP